MITSPKHLSWNMSLPSDTRSNLGKGGKSRASLPHRRSFFANIFASTKSPPSFQPIRHPKTSPVTPSKAAPMSLSTTETSHAHIIRNSSPDLYTDAAFSPDPRLNLYFVANPDPVTPEEEDDPEEGFSEFQHSRDTLSLSPGTTEATSLPTTAKSSAADLRDPPITHVETSSRAYTSPSKSDLKQRYEKEAQIEDHENISMNLPPPYEPPASKLNFVAPLTKTKPHAPPSTHSERRPYAPRILSAPEAPGPSQSNSLPVRPATTIPLIADSQWQNAAPPGPLSLDKIDELDETNPLGTRLHLHHEGPYEAIQRMLASPSNAGPAEGKKNSRHVYPTSKQAPGPMPYAAFGAPINLSPGQVLPSHFHPYQQPPKPVLMLSPNSHILSPQSHPQHVDPPAEFDPYTDFPVAKSTVNILQADEMADAYGGIIEEVPQRRSSPNMSQKHIEPYPARRMPQQPMPSHSIERTFPIPATHNLPNGSRNIQPPSDPYRRQNNGSYIAPRQEAIEPALVAKGRNQDSRERLRPPVVASTPPRPNTILNSRPSNLPQQGSNAPPPSFQSSTSRMGPQPSHIPRQLVMPSPLQQSRMPNSAPQTQYPQNFSQSHYKTSTPPKAQNQPPASQPRFIHDADIPPNNSHKLRKQSSIRNIPPPTTKPPVSYRPNPEYTLSNAEDIGRANTTRKPQKKVLTKRRSIF